MSRLVDVRGTRFAGALTFIGAALSVATGAWWLAALLAIVLLTAAWGGSRWSLWGRVYRLSLARALAAPQARQLEPDRPPRFANLVGGLFLAGAALSFGLGAVVVGAVLGVIVAALALLNATTGFCVGCRMYGLLVRDGPIVAFLGLR